jgi:nucleotide-binding universal stress UspA family protein
MYEPVYGPVIDMGTLSADVLGRVRSENRSAVEAIIAKFDRLANQAGLSAETRALDATFVGASGLFGRIARRFDLSIVGQAEPNKLAPEELIIEAALFESGRPVVVVPYIQKIGLKLDRIMVCWDGGHHAARAIADAMPFLERAKAIHVVIVANDAGKHDEVPGADMAHHLARHGLKVEVKRVVSPDLDVANTLLSYAADTTADFMVMGGYGHSRLREFILGGATRGVLSTMTVPTLMSH